jgi:hypothetical protein
MDKVWFKLRQTDYLPEDEENMGTGKDTAPICLSHFVSELKNIDFVLNRGAIEEFPPNMEVFHTNTIDFKWDDSQDSEMSGSLGAGAPIVAAAGLTIQGSIRLAFSRSVQNHEAYDHLDSYIVQPTKPYVADCLVGKGLKAHIGDRKI